MSDSSSSNTIEQIKSLLAQVSGVVAAAVVYLVALTGRSPGPFPQATAVLTVWATTIILCGWRWSQIIRQQILAEGQPSIDSAEPRPGSARSFLQDLLDPFRAARERSYVYSPRRCRAELSGLVLITLLSLIWTSFIAPQAITEVSGQQRSDLPVLACSGDSEARRLRLVIPQFKKAGNQPYNVEDRLSDSLAKGQTENLEICLAQEVVGNRIEARTFGERAQAQFVIWGRIDAAVYEINIEVIDATLPMAELGLAPLPATVLEDAQFHLRQADQIGFVGEFVLSQLLYLDQRPEAARQTLAAALEVARREGIVETNPQVLARAYFFLGFLADSQDTFSAQNQAQAITAYSQALDLDSTLDVARLNRGFAYSSLGESDKAIVDYSALITAGSALSATAYLNRAPLQPSQALAEADFAMAIPVMPILGYEARAQNRLDVWHDPAAAVQDYQEVLRQEPENLDRYYDLGRAQLIAGQPDEARRTYQDAVTYLTREDRAILLEELSVMMQEYPHLQEPIKAIQAELQAIPLR